METQEKAPSQQLVIKSFDFFMVWIAGAIFTLWGAIQLRFFPAQAMPFTLFNPLILISGLVMLLLYPNLTIVADRPTRTLRLEYRYLLFRHTKRLDFDDIAAIRAEYSRHTDSDGHTSSGYRLVADLIDGRTVPFRSSFGGADPKDATRLQGFIRRSKGRAETPEP
ncbi:MAG: hypothetical protein HYZ25_05520 [Chloroflexi bacterium]|nr:hypothetical protein [Chloroflexota bacterium]